jgi:hypothetical protein
MKSSEPWWVGWFQQNPAALFVIDFPASLLYVAPAPQPQML